jgi:hypothetical protein
MNYYWSIFISILILFRHVYISVAVSPCGFCVINLLCIYFVTQVFNLTKFRIILKNTLQHVIFQYSYVINIGIDLCFFI